MVAAFDAGVGEGGKLEDLKQTFPYGEEPIILNEIRRKYGLDPIPGGDVELISICDTHRVLDSTNQKSEP